MNIQKHEDGTCTVTVGDHSVSGVIFITIFGSHLYGLSGPDSDQDYKAVFVKDFPDLLLGEGSDTVVLSGNGSERNGKDDIDIEFIELRKFLNDALKGQTYAVEMLHVVDPLFTSPSFQEIQDNKHRILTRKMAPFMGYCVAQAKKYGLKGERLTDTEDVLAYFKTFPPYTKIQDILDGVPFGPHVFMVEKPLKNQDVMATLLEVNGKQFNVAVPLRDVVPVIQNLVDSYGERARKARDGVDWKAVSHAYRCIMELEEVMTTGNIVFPLRYSEVLKDVKFGRVPYEQVQDELPQLIERVAGLESNLPEEPDNAFWRQWMIDYYTARYFTTLTLDT